MIYIVTGMPRSGTSAMMRALIMGGMHGNYFAPIDAIIGQYEHLKRPDYDPNPHGFFEHGFIPAFQAHGMLSKIMLDRFDVHCKPLMAVVMHRTKTERAASLAEWDLNTDKMLQGFKEHYARFQKMHPDAGIVDVDYPELIAHPHQELYRLQDAGWPIDVASAARAIDPTLYRHRNESCS